MNGNINFSLKVNVLGRGGILTEPVTETLIPAMLFFQIISASDGPLSLTIPQRTPLHQSPAIARP